VISCEHAGKQVPSEYAGLFRGQSKLLSTHRGYDIGIEPVARMLATSLEAPYLAHHVTRLLVDVNRSAHNPSVFSEFSNPLPADEKKRILAHYYQPHRRAVEGLIRKTIQHHTVIHFGLHSFTPELKGQLRDFEIGLLYDPERVREKEFCRRLKQALLLQEPAWRIMMNRPYRGASDGLTTSLRAAFPLRRYLGIEIEINQSLLQKFAMQKKIAACLSAAINLSRQASC
jgi:predicted N-formylglutamate amidohydrolase